MLSNIAAACVGIALCNVLWTFQPTSRDLKCKKLSFGISAFCLAVCLVILRLK